jgi:hypothetical protein
MYALMPTRYKTSLAYMANFAIMYTWLAHRVLAKN